VLDIPSRKGARFIAGLPIALNGQKNKLSLIIKQLNSIGAAYSVGFVYLIKGRVFGLKVRGVYENLVAIIIITAHKKLEQLFFTRKKMNLNR